MADKSFADGAVLPASDVNSYLAHTGGAWNSWTPTIVQSGSVASTAATATYWRAGRLIVATLSVSITATGTAANVVTVSLPVTAAGSGVNVFVGTGKLFDASTGFEYPALVVLNSSTTCKLFSTASTGAAAQYLGAAGFTAAVASGDVVAMHLVYEAAAG